MANRAPGSRPGRTLGALGLLVLVMAGTLFAGIRWSDASLAPKLALDLAGGTQIVLTPVVEPGQGEITDQTIDDAIAIIRQRVNASGVSEAEVSSQGGRNIVVELPGSPEEQAQARELVRQSAQMRFRPVLVEAAALPPQPEPTAEPTAEPTGEPTAEPSGDPTTTPTGEPTGTPTQGATSEPDATIAPAPTATTDQRAVPRHLGAAGTPTTPATPAPTGEPADQTATEGAPGEEAPAPEPTSPSDLAWITPEIQQQFAELDCTDESNLTGGAADDPTQPLVTCSQDGLAKYILGPVEVEGTNIASAEAGLAVTAQGVQTNTWVVQLEFDDEGAEAFRETTERLVTLPPPQNQFAIVLDGLVVSAPRVNEPIPTGQAEISGSFDQESAQTLANQLKFGALPISFQVETEDQISALLGSEQLQRGLLAGVIGLGLVVVYSVLQYRALGLVTVASLLLAGLITYLAIALLSWYQGYRLSLPGVAGLIVAIGITVDSFIVYFERVRDEVREGRSLIVAVENGWKRARRTILASDSVNFLAAVVLYLLAVGGVRGFAFTLGLTTLIDLLVVVMFTHPVLVLLARTKFFGGGHRLSGFDAEHLGRTVAYAGRGRVRQPGRGRRAPAAPDQPRMTLAERKAAQRKAEQERAAQEQATAQEQPAAQEQSEPENAGSSRAKES
ncbi:protein translocase subunit SecD [Quadrisphaera sp. GCM10027208]|uniref:protein translocase subunit SecD n=1 Tax=Quadrisphaera sp. GCM10027208 TaxID=3273423 RepID=UPI00360985C6